MRDKIIAVALFTIIIIIVVVDCKSLNKSLRRVHEGMTGAPKKYKLNMSLSRELGQEYATGDELAAHVARRNQLSGETLTVRYIPDLELIRVEDIHGVKKFSDIPIALLSTDK